MNWRYGAAEWLEAGLQLLFPSQCPACGVEVARRDAWCSRCLNELWDPRTLNLNATGMRHAKTCRVLTGYGGTVRTLLHGLKFERRRQNAAPLAWLVSMADAAELIGLPLADGLVIPVPLAATRLAERGFNQVDLIYADWCVRQNLEWQGGVLLRQRDTLPQWELDRQQRRENMNGAFVCNAPEKIRHRHILLVDDIVTTGATLEQCASVLCQAGAASVSAFCLAHG